MTLACLGMTMVCFTGCAGSLPAREELSQALTRSFDATGWNYRSTSSIQQLKLRRLDDTLTAATSIRNSERLLDIARGFSVGVTGTVDIAAGKTEALYDLRYSRDNTDVSLRLPLLVDYASQTIYLGPSLLHTLLDVASPADAQVRGKLIRISVPELLKDESEASGRLSRILGGRNVATRNLVAMNKAFRDTALKTVSRLDPARISELPLAAADREEGVRRRIRLNLGRGESLDLIVEWLNAVSAVLLREGVLEEKEQGLLAAVSDRATLDKLLDGFDFSLTLDLGVSSSGHIAQVRSRLDLSDRGETLGLVLENSSRIHGYGAPRFSIIPEETGCVEFGDVIKAIESIKKKGGDAAGSTGREEPPAVVPPAEERTGGNRRG